MKFVDPKEFINIFILSKQFQTISTDPSLWHSLYNFHYPNKPCDQTTDWRSNFTTAWVYEHSNQWDDSPEIRTRRYHKNYKVEGKTVTHLQATTYLPIRAKYGYSSGVHYWEVLPHNNQHGTYNTYIGVATVEVDMNWNLGKDSYGWGLRGFNGQFFHHDQVAASSKTFIDDSDTTNRIKSYYNDKPVGLQLDMDNCVLDYFVEGIHVLSFKEERWRVREVCETKFDIVRERRYILQLL